MSAPPANLAPALDLYRRGDLAGARQAAEAALAGEPDSAVLLGFAGLVAAQLGDFAAAIGHLRAAVRAAPEDQANRLNLAMALLQTSRFDEAAGVCTDGGDDPKLLRIAAYAHQQSGRLDLAAAAYEQVLAAFPEDFESWNNLGNVRLAAHDANGAAEAFRTAIRLRPDIVEMVFNLSEALAAAERHDERLAAMRQDPRLQTELGLAAASVRAHDEAEQAFRAALRADPRCLSAYLELGLLLENLNRVDELAALVATAETAGVDDPELGFLKAWTLRRQGRLEEALPIAEAIPETIHPVRRARLLAELADRLGQTERAFAEFTEMNAASVAKQPPQRGPSYREHVGESVALLTQSWVDSWEPVALDREPSPPIFLVGFPRSGTTLLDTLLMNMPNLHVLEEMPVMSEVDAALGDEARLAALTDAEANALRRLYFEAVARLAPPSAPGQTIVDKHPLRMARMAIVHRLFPDAKVILVERHPCDVVLSCFMANFHLNTAMRSFASLEEAARTYDAVFEAWTRATELLPIKVHRIRYERMVADLEGEMRPLLEFLGLPWDPSVLDNQAAAAERGHVRTASYSQVTEPIYKRAAGRWERYRRQLAPVLPILAPWIERLGYDPPGEGPSAEEALEQAVAGNPAWAEGHVQLARLRWASGERENFARSFEGALAAAPRDTRLWSQYLASLMYAGRHEQILEAAGRGRAAAGPHPLFDLADAVAYDDLGDLAASAPRFAGLAESRDPAVAIYRVRHLLRAGDYAAAAALAEQWQQTDGGDHFAPYLATAWRLTGDPRWQWLEGDERLVGTYDLAEAIGPLAPLAALLRGLHEHAGQPLDQSVRGGTQIDEVLSRQEPEIVRRAPRSPKRSIATSRSSRPSIPIIPCCVAAATGRSLSPAPGRCGSPPKVTMSRTSTRTAG
jgi:tetratricopeptide (TPR) repeat protein